MYKGQPVIITDNPISPLTFHMESVSDSKEFVQKVTV